VGYRRARCFRIKRVKTVDEPSEDGPICTSDVRSPGRASCRAGMPAWPQPEPEDAAAAVAVVAVA
jgi:hypothetical protein